MNISYLENITLTFKNPQPFNINTLQIKTETNFLIFDKKIKIPKEFIKETKEQFSIINNSKKENFKNLSCDEKIEFSLNSNTTKYTDDIENRDILKKIKEKSNSKLVTFSDANEIKRQNSEKTQIFYNMKVNFKKKNQFNFDNYKKQLKYRNNNYETHNYNHSKTNFLEDKNEIDANQKNKGINF